MLPDVETIDDGVRVYYKFRGYEPVNALHGRLAAASAAGQFFSHHGTRDTMALIASLAITLILKRAGQVNIPSEPWHGISAHHATYTMVLISMPTPAAHRRGGTKEENLKHS